MSWEVGDDEWLAEPPAVPSAGPLDPLDERVMQALATSGTPTSGTLGAPQHSDVNGFDAAPSPTTSPSAPLGSSFELPLESLPPPPYSAAFDSSTSDTPSYESGSFVSDPEPADEPEPDFHIPVLTLGVVTEPAASAEVEPAAFVIPTLSATSTGAATDDGLEEVEAEEVEEVEEVEQPIRTGDTVIGRAPEPEPTVTNAVYDDEDDAALVIPELVDRVDSAELEIMIDPADDAFDTGPVHTSVDPETFTIPALARPEHDGALVSEETALDDAGPEIVIPVMVAAAQPDLPDMAAPESTVEEPPAESAVERVEDAEDLQEVEAEAIESLDSADLEELEQLVAVAVAVESPEPRPPAPPDAKPQAKRRKAWYDDVFVEHFLFLYPLTWEQSCQRDAQFMFAQLGARDGMSVLDVGCGDGSHAVALAKLGVRVTGLDNSLALLLAAAQTKEGAGFEDGRVEFIHGDMRRLPRDREFDAVICVGTTLGYFEEDQNWLCLQEMHDRLLPGGRLLIHVFNRDFVAPHLPSRSWWQGKRCMVIDEAEMNFFANRLRVHRTIIFDDGRQYEHYMFMRAYTVQDLGKAISQLGMRVLQVSGSRDTAGRFYGSASPDIWIVAEKK